MIFRLPKKSVLTVCLESANQNSVLSAAIIYLSLDEYDDEEIDLAIGIPIMYTLICVIYDGLGGLISCQLKWVNCKTPDDPDYIEPDDGDDTITLSHLLYKWKQYRDSKRTMALLSDADIDYGGTGKGKGSKQFETIVMSKSKSRHSNGTNGYSFNNTLDSTNGYHAGTNTLEQASSYPNGNHSIERSSQRRDYI